MVIPKVGKDPEQNLVGCFDEFKVNNGNLQCLKGKIYSQHPDTCDMEWLITQFIELVYSSLFITKTSIMLRASHLFSSNFSDVTSVHLARFCI